MPLIIAKRVPTAVYDRLLRLSYDIDRQRERNGRVYANVPQTEQGVPFENCESALAVHFAPLAVRTIARMPTLIT